MQVAAFLFSPPLPSKSWLVCLTPLAMFGVMETQPHFVVETAPSGLGTVGEGRSESLVRLQRAQNNLPCLGTVEAPPHWLRNDTKPVLS